MKKLFVIFILFLIGSANAANERSKPNVYRASTIAAPALINNTAQLSSTAAITQSSGTSQNFNATDDLIERANQKISDTKKTCLGIFEQLQDIQLLTGVAVTVSAIGTAAGAVALTTGVMKFGVDTKVEDLEKMLSTIKDMSDENWFAFLYQQAELEQQEKMQQEIDELNKESITLGNVRTGTLAGTTVMSGAGAISSAFTVSKLDVVIKQIIECKAKVSDLAKIKYESDFSGISDPVITKVSNIVESCSAMNPDSLQDIKNQMTGVAIISGVGGTVALGGTIVSGFANSNEIRNDNSDQGKETEKNLNFTANITAGVATATSGTSTIISAISATNLTKNAEAASRCKASIGE